VTRPGRTDPDPGSFAERLIGGRDGVVALRVRGLDRSRRPVLLLHGLGSNARIWDAVAWRLVAAGHPVAAVDLPGHGRSGRPLQGFTWPALVDTVARAATSLGWTGERRPVVAGHHLGANLAVEVAGSDPGLVAALVLVDGGAMELSGRYADRPTCEVALAPTVSEGSDGARLARMRRAIHADWPEESLAGALADLVWHADGTVGPILRPDDHLALLRLLWDQHPRAQLARLPGSGVNLIALAPGTAGSGGRSTVASREELVGLSQACPSATVRWVPGDSELHAQQPDLVADVIGEADPLADGCSGRKTGDPAQASANAEQQVSTIMRDTT
jgi:pimeloyl-ACP methyl ester carboxylesterase